jgi:hypothetical protein
MDLERRFQLMESRLRWFITDFIPHDGFELDEVAEMVDCVEVDADVVEEPQLPRFADLAAQAICGSEGSFEQRGIGDGHDMIEAGLELSGIGTVVPDEFGGGGVDFAELQPPLRNGEIGVELHHGSRVAGIEQLERAADERRIGATGFQFDVASGGGHKALFARLFYLRGGFISPGNG